MLQSFWKWYEEKYHFIVPITAILFCLQVVHLYWMTTNVVFIKLFGHAFWNTNHFWNTVIALVDYTEIPAIITSTVLYVHQFKLTRHRRNLMFILLINSQWIHLFWITDEVIYAQFTGTALVALPLWLSWGAIAIDYLEIPVMFDTAAKSLRLLRKTEV